MSTVTEQIIDKLELGNFFLESKLDYDLRQGVIWNPAKTRVCLLSTDLLTGIYKAILDEAGPAWKLIFKNCGQIWGERVARRLDRECQVLLGCRMGELSLDDYLSFMSGYFLFHGWGHLQMDVARARETGIVEASLNHSVFAEIVKSEEDMADPMIAGILSGMLSYLSGHDLDCIQTACLTKGSDRSRFVITGAERLKEADSKISSGLSHEYLCETL
jgi:predicted hydrocarbon binding protein